MDIYIKSLKSLSFASFGKLYLVYHRNLQILNALRLACIQTIDFDTHGFSISSFACCVFAAVSSLYKPATEYCKSKRWWGGLIESEIASSDGGKAY